MPDKPIGEIVWAKVKNHPFWPAIISEYPETEVSPKKKNGYYINFFGTNEHGWVKKENCKDYEQHYKEHSSAAKNSKPSSFDIAVKEIQKLKSGRTLRKNKSVENIEKVEHLLKSQLNFFSNFKKYMLLEVPVGIFNKSIVPNSLHNI